MALSLLLVEDNARTRENIVQILKQTPFTVTIAVDGLDGLNRAKLEHFDVVLTDHKMPLMDGILLIKNLRDETPYAQTPLLLMTTSDPEQISAKAERCGADLVLGKPLDADLLLFKLRQLTQSSVVA
ncbi:two-component system response regulator [Aliidiomarina shirensis]|uniref:Two-component system response regulator n=1 Tax=Aliidiomarina shirensis TaxID=1048642 RepID=A0A432WU03_9GAMM|nr:response regulator [Aliidiomarina shirensis]RUO37245.1 two-component system response regulator [Aliidiomarina shirensis]